MSGLGGFNMGKILCFFGWHKWTWKFENGRYPVIISNPPPDNAKCSRCGKRYVPLRHAWVLSEDTQGMVECSVCRYTIEVDDSDYKSKLFHLVCPGKDEDNFIGD